MTREQSVKTVVGLLAVFQTLMACMAVREHAADNRKREFAEAVFNGEVGEVRRLLDKGADPNGRNYEVSLWGTRDEWSDLFRPVGKKEGGHPPLMHAVLSKKPKIVRLLLEHGADPRARFADGCTPLHVAAGEGDTKSVTLLLDAGADPNARERRSGATPLMYAAVDDRRECAALLLRRGADAWLRTNKGRTALDVARRRKHSALTKMLDEVTRTP